MELHRFLLGLGRREGRFISVNFSPDAKWLAAGATDGLVYIWNAATGELLQSLEGHSGEVTSVAFSQDSLRLASSSTDKAVWIWDVISGAPLLQLKGHVGCVTSVAFSPDGARLASSSYDMTVWLWDARNGAVLRRFNGHGGPVKCVAYSPDGMMLASGSEDSTVRLWDVSRGILLRVLEGHECAVTSLVYSPDGKCLVSGSNDDAIIQWNAQSGAVLRILEGHESSVSCVVYNPEGSQLMSASWDGTIRLWDAVCGKKLARYLVDSYELVGVAYSSDGKCIASSSLDSYICVLEAASGKLLYRLHGQGESTLCLAYSPDGKRMASCSYQNKPRLWNADDGVELFGEVEKYSKGSACDAALRQLDINKGFIKYVAISPDGNQVAEVLSDHSIKLTYKKIKKIKKIRKSIYRLEGHSDKIVNLVFTADNDWLISVSDDRTVRLWRLSDGVGVIVAKIASAWQFMPLMLMCPPSEIGATKFGNAVRIEEICFDITEMFRDIKARTWYVSAKVVLLGNSGVGKTSLARRLLTNQYESKLSTHAMELQTFAPELLDPAATAPTGERREVVLWDLGGQEEYRLVHQLFMHDTQLALLLCDPTRGQDQYSAVLEWNAMLEKQRGGVPTIKLLVGCRVDDPTTLLDQAMIDATLQACQARRFIATSAKEGHGIDELKQALAAAIDWDEIAKTSRPVLFQRTRDRIEAAREQGVISLPLTELREQVRAADPEEYDEAALNLVVEQLSRQGVIVDTCRANGERELVLKLAEIERYAGSLILMARQARLQTGMGVPAIEVSALQAEKMVFPRIADKDRLSLAQERIVLECVVQLLIERGICLAHSGLLVFPSLYPQGKCEPIDGTDSVSLYYNFTGPSDALYAQFAARAASARRFGRVRLSAGRAEFGQRDVVGLCGVQYQAVGQGRGRIDIYFSMETPVATRQLFRAFVEDFLKEHGVDVREVVALRCQECQHVFAEADVCSRIENGKESIFCPTGHSTPIDAAFKDARANSPDLAVSLAALKTDVDRRTEQEARTASDKISSATASTTSAGVSMSTTGRPLNLLHLSDLHFSASTDPVQMLQPLIADLTDRQGLKLEKLDYLVVSGDCTCIGSAEEFGRVQEFLELLVKRFGLSAQRCVLVPGNHDLSWNVDVYDWLSERRAVEVKNLDAERWKEEGKGFLVRRDAEYGNRFENFATFHHQFIQQPYPLEAAKQAQVYIHDRDRIQFIGLNSACRIDEHFPERSAIDDSALSLALQTASEQIDKAVAGKRIPDRDDVLRIAVWHHPITGNEKITADAFVQRLQQADVRLCLHGHIHENRADLIGYTHPTRRLHAIGAGSFGAVAKDRPESTPRLYNLIEIAADRSQVRVHTRQMPKTGGAWGPNSVWPDGAGGCRHWYDIPLR